MAEPIAPTVPQADIVAPDFDFRYGELKSLHRIVARRKLKDRVKFLEQVIRMHQPLIAAMKATNKAYQDGIMEGIRQVAEAEREKEVAAAKATPTAEVPTAAEANAAGAVGASCSQPLP